MERPRIYLTGFDVFRLDAVQHGQHLKALCRQAGFDGLFPLDIVVDDCIEPDQQAAWVCENNLSLIRTCDAVMVNLDDIRSIDEPDTGTAFDVGFAAALGKPVFAYAKDVRPLIHRVPNCRDVYGQAICERGYPCEDFGLPMNLMLARSITLIEGGPSECLTAIAIAKILHAAT
ncbi:nucleoside 2-deoxyribosyltransferase [Burkholderia alba]|uniref:nucleoside 2-deoxyribosyltransferase n=1 Tax=Burkholderia alba TaxID=2683677 RepID=UPI002B053CD0|nr:nucleoside 2-deoxyribosyltransferase [Burkholderia alba]